MTKAQLQTIQETFQCFVECVEDDGDELMPGTVAMLVVGLMADYDVCNEAMLADVVDALMTRELDVDW